MAEILFMNRSNGPNAAHWKLGDIVAVQEDGHEWGLLEAKSKWIAAGRIGAEWTGAFSLIAKGEFVSNVDLTEAQIKDKIRRKDTNAAATW
jgi:hypothetical protein